MPRPLSFLLVLALLSAAPQAQSPRSLRPEEYGRWELLVPQRTPLSADGRWLVYGIRRADRQDQLRVQPASGGDAVTLPYGELPAFSDDSRWLACLTGVSEEQEAKLKKDQKPVHKSLALVELATGKVQTIEDVESFAFSATGTHLAFRRYAPEPAAGTSAAAPAGADETPAPGTALTVRELITGRDTTFANVSEMAWQDQGARLAFAVTVEGGIGNGVQLFDASSGTLRVLDSSSFTYSGLAWRKEAASLAVLRSQARDDRDGSSNVVLAWSDAGLAQPSAKVLDASSGLNEHLRIVRFRQPQWSEDGSIIYVGVGPWLPKPARPAADSLSRRLAATSGNPDELPDVQVWHPADTTVMARQKIDAKRDRERSMLAAFSVEDGRFVRIAERLGEDATPIHHQPRALVVDTNAFAMDRSIGRVFANAWTVDLKSGARSEVLTHIEDDYLQASPGGNYLLYRKGDHFWARDLSSGQEKNLTASLRASFVDIESDETGPTKPMFGIAGWTRDDGAVLLYDKYDIWEVPPDGTRPTRLTNGAANDIRHRYVRLDREEEFIDRTNHIYVSTFGLRSKKAGYSRIEPGSHLGAVTPLIWMDKRVTALAKAKRADRYVYSLMDFDDSPDYFSSDNGFADARQVTRTNPFMSEYAWGRSALIDYKSAQGAPLQGALFYPAGYDPSKKYPMVVYMYEKLSDGVHQFSMPSERDYYNAASFTTHGYLYLQPDIVFRPREPGLSVVDSVVPAVQKVIQMGAADPKKIGIVGHSWGGFDTVFLATHSDIFAAAVAGAPITDLVSNYGNHHWSSGIAETDHIETGQQRMAVPLYEDLQAYIRNSAVFATHTIKTPLLVEVGDSDGTVFWHQGVELYNIARRAGKQVVLLQYGGEDHGLRKKGNQIDYHHRILEWFDHYLAGAPAPSWITSGERYIDRERDLQQRKLPVPATETTTAGKARSQK